MANTNITAYADDFIATVSRQLGASAPLGDLDRLRLAAQQLKLAADGGAAVDWDTAATEWTQARDALLGQLAGFLTEGLPELPGLDALARAVGWNSGEGLSGSVEVGPFRLGLAPSSLMIRPGSLPPITLGPLRPSGIEASIALPGGGAGMPGGGSLMRLAHGFGGTLSVPIGPVMADAAAVVETLPDGTPSLLAIIGMTFMPPVQLSFGFSLDRIGGIVGANRTSDTDALAQAVRTGAAGNVLFAAAPPASPGALVTEMGRLFPARQGRHLGGPTLHLSWLSMGVGSLMSLDIGVIIEFPSVRITVLGVAKAEIPGMPGLLHLRLDVLGIVDPDQSLVSIDASLVDSHVLGIFSVYGDAALRLNWGSQAYAVVSVGGFFPGFNPEPARLPAMRRAGMSLDLPSPLPMYMRAEGYFAVTTNTIQLGCRIEASISMGLLSAHGFLQVDALVQFRPFYFVAQCAAGFDVGVAGFSFGGVRLDGTVSGPGPFTVRGKLTIETFLFDLSWDETFTFGSGPSDRLTANASLLAAMEEELARPGNMRAQSMHDAAVVLKPGLASSGNLAAVPPAGTLSWSQGRAPLGVAVDRVDGMPLPARQTVVMGNAGAAVKDRFSPGSYCTLTQSEALNRPPFDLLDAGLEPALAPAPSAPMMTDDSKVKVVVVMGEQSHPPLFSGRFDLTIASLLVDASRGPPALSSDKALVTATRETWTHIGTGTGVSFDSATAAHQAAKRWPRMTAAVAYADASAPVDLSGI
ncbi:DUF6603 domain-containing protein [Pseudoxanthomonas putridarboris]|uniref:DUF6603 domain-containing protein n=1 Tax=Pseudoxanthomonas putridarboris TaxID=752605 RepID=A0ABU9IZM4_9GAMM